MLAYESFREALDHVDTHGISWIPYLSKVLPYSAMVLLCLLFWGFVWGH